MGQKRDYSARSVRSVVNEIEEIPAGVILFSDENFSVDPKRAETPASCGQKRAEGIIEAGDSGTRQPGEIDEILPPVTKVSSITPV